jgi:ABC-2 type transport system ATP-binding protein
MANKVSDTILRTTGLTKRFGAITAVDHLDLEILKGEVFGFLGPNGSGKSTTVGLILGLIAPNEGRVELNVPLRKIGAIVEAPAFYPYLSGRDNLRAISLAVGGVPRGRVEELLLLVGLSDRANSPYKTYSLGMKQRLGIASTLLTDPQLVILDEPTNGLDPAGQREVRALIPRLAKEGHTVFVASHLLHEVQLVCDRVAILRRGKLLELGKVSDLLQRGSNIEFHVDEFAKAAEVLKSLGAVKSVTIQDSHLMVEAPDISPADLVRGLGEAGIYPMAVIPRKSTLEEVFLEVTEQANEGTESGSVS